MSNQERKIEDTKPSNNTSGQYHKNKLQTQKQQSRDTELAGDTDLSSVKESNGKNNANNSKGKATKNKKKAVRIRKKRPWWQKLLLFIAKWLFILLCLLAAIIVGMVVGFSVIGDGEWREVLSIELWQHIYDLVFKTDM